MDLKILALAFALAFLSESLVEYLLGTPMDKIPKLAPWKWTLMYASGLMGTGLAFWYSLDLISVIAGKEPTWVGILLTGIMIGRGANWLHDFIGKYLPGPTK